MKPNNIILRPHHTALIYTIKNQTDFASDASSSIQLRRPRCFSPPQHGGKKEEKKKVEVELYLLLELRQLAGQLRHQSDGAVQLLLQRAHLVLLVVSLAAHQRHGSHTGEPLQVLLLGGGGGKRERERE